MKHFLFQGMYTNNLQPGGPKNDEFHVTVFNSIKLGSEEDLDMTSSNPLQRALFCLYRALHLSAGNIELEEVVTLTSNEFTIPTPKEKSANIDMDCYNLALVSLAYVKLQLNDASGALEITRGLTSSEGNQDSNITSMAEIYTREAMVHISEL